MEYLTLDQGSFGPEFNHKVIMNVLKNLKLFIPNCLKPVELQGKAKTGS